ncbi:MAG: chromosome segregation protein SMC [Candidatus Aminicenantes bacterium]
MIIKKLELQGFKSFPEKTKILFHPGITVVVGPNGTGKSNIVDAFLWVLGGRRFKAYRGERSTDIIFNGNEKRAPLSMADVNLHLSEDQAREELIISHRYFRSGESEYRLNGKSVRLKDIQECLWKKEVGEKEYFVIEQGSIGLFLSSKPADKRMLVEEAAGTSYYKDKKRQAENKLESSEQNLVRLEDIINEVSKAKNSLKRQAREAARYRKLREKIRKLTTLHFRKKIGQLEEGQTEASSHYKTFLNQEKKATARIKEEEKHLASSRKEAWTLEKEVKEEQKKIYSLESTLSRLEAEGEENKNSIDFLEERKQKATQNMNEANQEAAQLEKEQNEAQDDLKSFRKNLAQKKKDSKSLSAVIQKIQKEKDSHQQNLESLKNEYFQGLSSSTELKNEKARLEKEAELLSRQQDKIKSQMEKENASLRLTEEKERRQAEELSRIQKQKKELKKEIDSSQKQKQHLLSSLEALQRKMNGFTEKREKEIHHVQLLQEIREKEQSGEGKEEMPGSFGYLADFVESDPRYTPLIDIFWKEEAKALLFKAPDFLKILDKKNLRGNFLLLHPQAKKDLPSRAYQDPRVLGRLKSHVRAASKAKGFVSLLDEAAMVENVKTAVELWLEFPSLNFLTLQGEVLHSSGLLKAGTQKRGLFTAAAEIKNSKQRISALEKEISPLSAKIKEISGKIQKTDKDIEDKSDKTIHLEKLAEEIERHRAIDRSEKEKLEMTLTTLKNEHDILTADQENMEKRLASVSSKIKESQQKEQTLNKDIQSTEEQFEALQKKGEQKRRQFFELKSEIDLFQEKINNLDQRLKNLKKRKDLLSKKGISFHTEAQNAEEKISELRENMTKLSEETKSLKKEKKSREAQLSQNESRLNRLQREQKESEERIEKWREEYEQVKGQRVEWEIKKAERERDLANLEESCWQELKKSISEVKKELSVDEIKDEDTQAKLEDAKEKLQKIKAVNLMAEEEYQNQKKRHDYLIQQKKDLRESIDTTKQAIKKIDQESRTQFLKALAEINKNFQDVFTLLFNGGRAELKLTDESSPLESGVDIAAQPPGKRLQSLSLLSGGEKSLTSLAFFFGLFRYKPTPFCVLDEVDAALDEVNLQRFLNLMKRIKNQTQFILITHNFKTMEVADYIYGTTMAEPNFTTLYSVQLDKKRRPVR